LPGIMRKKIYNWLIEIVEVLRFGLWRGKFPNPFLAGLVLVFLYFFIFQRNFLFSGDIFAEAFADFLAKARTGGWSVVFGSTWAGYLSFSPFAFAKLYLWFGLPLGYIDYYFRFISVSFAGLCAAFIAHPANRKIIKNDYLRLVLVFAVISLFRHPSFLSFINTWYAAIAVIVLVSLSGVKLEGLKRIGFVVFSVLVMLTRPMLPVLPFLVYRAFRGKAYVSSGLVMVAMIFSILFAVNHSPGSISLDSNIFEKASDLVLGAGVLTLKMFSIEPKSIFYVCGAVLFLLAAEIFVMVKKDFWLAAYLGIGIFVATFFHVHSPDYGFSGLSRNFRNLFFDEYKVQREFAVYFLILLLLFIFFDVIFEKIRRSKFPKSYYFALILFLIFFPAKSGIFKTIDVENSALDGNIDRFRQDLSEERSVCVPLLPYPSWGSGSFWVFQNKDGCEIGNRNREADYDSFDYSLNDSGQVVEIESPEGRNLKTLLFLVKNYEPEKPAEIHLTDINSEKIFSAKIKKKKSETFTYVAFNLSSLESRPVYVFNLVAEKKDGLSEKTTLGKFKDGGFIFYTYSIFEQK